MLLSLVFWSVPTKFYCDRTYLIVQALYECIPATNFMQNVLPYIRLYLLSLDWSPLPFKILNRLGLILLSFPPIWLYKDAPAMLSWNGNSSPASELPMWSASEVRKIIDITVYMWLLGFGLDSYPQPTRPWVETPPLRHNVFKLYL